MRRPAVPKSAQTEILLSSRRRCAICFGLNRDTSLKSGQIAHLDHNPFNNGHNNLVFLCFDHHDLYDSRTKQSKNLTVDEVIAFRAELVTSLQEAFSTELTFGSAKTSRKEGSIEGHYVRDDGGDGSYQSAEIKISRIASRHSQYHVSGFALWGKKRHSGPNTGEFNLIMELRDSEFFSEQPSYTDKPYKLNIAVDGRRLLVSEENWGGRYGMNVYFFGEYERST